MTRLNLDTFDTLLLLFSWYIKPLLINETFLYNFQFLMVSALLFIMAVLLKSTSLLIIPLLQIFSTIKLTSFFSIFMGLKFVILIGLLIVVRGGIPRYRYDFLTKLGWIKTLSLVLAIFLINLILAYL